MFPGISERMYFLFCTQATNYHGLVEALLTGQKISQTKIWIHGKDADLSSV